MKLRKPKSPKPSATKPERSEPDQKAKREPNPPHTTTGWLTSPKFGSAGSGGAEYEPGPDLN